MHTPTRYRSPYRRIAREVHNEPVNSDIRERFIVQGMICGVVLAVLLATVLTGLPFTERIRADVENQLRIDYTDSLPLDPVANMFEQARYLMFGDLPQTAAPAASEPVPPAFDPAPPAPAAPPPQSMPGMAPPMSYEDNENNTFYDLGDEERLFIEDIIRRIHEAGSQGQYEDAARYDAADAPDEYPEYNLDDFGAHTLAPAVPPGSARVSSPFGYRTNPVTGISEMHNGVDMAFAHGTPVVAIQDGVVTEIGYNAYSGNYLRYMTSDGLLVGYAHLYRPLVQVGDIVRQGDAVALTGNSGFSTGPHLHVTIWQDGITIDPLTIFAAH